MREIDARYSALNSSIVMWWIEPLPEEA